MTQEEKRTVVLKDLCGRLPYGGVILQIGYGTAKGEGVMEYNDEIMSPTLLHDILTTEYSHVKPYLRPMSSMTNEEAKELFLLHNEDRKECEILGVSIGDKYIDFKIDDGCCSFESHTIWYEDAVGSIKSFDWLNKKMFDYRGLIPMGLALPAPEGMYNE